MKKRFLIITSSIALTALISAPLTMDILLYALPNVYQETYYGALEDKINLLKDKSNKRIIIVGGSSVPFSIDCSYLKEYLPSYQPIDFGLYASLGTNMMLDIVSRYLNKEDIIIISPEISSQTLSLYFNGGEALKALENNKDFLFTLDDRLSKSVLASIPTFVSDKVSYLSHNNIPQPSDIYARSSFNEYGDIKVNREGNILYGGVDYNKMISLDPSLIDHDFVNYLNAFNDKCLKKGAKCYYRFAPMNDSSLINKDNLENFYDFLNEQLKFEIMGNPYHAILEKEYFYDTNYHLNSAGVINWSKELIKDIKLTLDDTSPTPIEEVDKPPLLNPSSLADGDNTYSDYFIYEENGNGYIINKLIKEATKIVVPYKFNDKIITHFKKDTFINDKTIEEITIQDNIRMIYDRSFMNTRIKKIIILNGHPNTIAVGDHLLDGTDAYIYVNKDNYTKYKTSYSWAKYASRIRTL